MSLWRVASMIPSAVPAMSSSMLLAVLAGICKSSSFATWKMGQKLMSRISSKPVMTASLVRRLPAVAFRIWASPLMPL